METAQPVPSACLPQLGELLHWEGLDEEPAAQLGVELIEGRVPAKVETHPTEEVLRRINREYRVAEKMFSAYAGHTVRLLQTLGENCFYAFSAPTNTPYEFENTPDGHEIAAGHRPGPLSRGHSASTSAPTRKECRTIATPGSYGQLVYQKHAMEEIAAFRSLIKGWMVRGEVQGQPEDERRRSRSYPS